MKINDHQQKNLEDTKKEIDEEQIKIKIKIYQRKIQR